MSRVEARRAHAEVERDQQIELAFRRLVVPHDFRRFRFFHPQVFALHAVAGAEQVLEEVLVTFARRSEQVGAPHEHVARPVVGVVRVGAAHLQRTVFETLDDVILGLHADARRVADDLQRVRLQLRRGRQPAHALGAHVVVDHAAAIQLLVGQRRDHFFHAQLLVAPLVGVRVEEARAVHLTGRTDPVEREGQCRPSGLRAQLFLSHVVRPATATLTDATAHHQHVDDAAIVHVAVVPVIHRGADDHHGLALGLVRVIGELARNCDQLCARRAGNALLPGRRIGRVIIEVLRGKLPRQTPGHAIVGNLQVEHGSHERLPLFTGLAERDPPHGNGTNQHVCLQIVRKMFTGDSTEVGETHLRCFGRWTARLPAAKA